MKIENLKYRLESLVVKLIIINLLIVNISCIEEVKNVNLPKNEPKLVVFSLITPGDSVKVRVHKSVPVFEESYDQYSQTFPPVTNAQVTLTDDSGNQINAIYQSNLYLYAISPDRLVIQPGKIYSIKVSLPGYNTVTATTLVPDYFPEISKIIIDSLKSADFYYNGYDLLVKSSIKDNLGTKNYYRTQVLCYGMYYSGSIYLMDLKNGKEVFSDVSYDGKEITTTTTSSGTDYDSVGVYAYSIDVNYYLYYKTLLDFDSSNPFTEPIPVYTNLSNGLGVFGSYIESKKFAKVRN